MEITDKEEALVISAKEVLKKNEWLFPVAILVMAIFGYWTDIGDKSNASHMDSRIQVDVRAVIGSKADTLNKSELSRIYLENSVQNESAGYEMVWATSCSSANVRVAGLDELMMKKLNPAITSLNNKYGKAEYKTIDRIFGQRAYSVCTMYDVDLNETQKYALSNLRSENNDFRCLTPLRRVCSMVLM